MKKSRFSLHNALMMAITGIICLIVIETLINSIDTTGWNSAVTTFVSTLVPIIMASTVVMGVFKMFAGDDDMETIENKGYFKRYKIWGDFGNRLKAGYVAKFGYSNSAFDEDVDMHISAMRALGKGTTKTINEEWIKRMAKFVEVPFNVPEEERWTEEEKVKTFKRGIPPEVHRAKRTPMVEQAVAEQNQGMNQMGMLTGIAMGLAMAEEQTSQNNRQCWVETSCKTCDSWDKALQKCTLGRVRAKAEPEFKPDAGYEEEKYSVDETPKVEPVTDKDVEGLFDGEYANKPTPKMKPRPRRGFWRRIFSGEEEAKVAVKTKK